MNTTMRKGALIRANEAYGRQQMASDREHVLEQFPQAIVHWIPWDEDEPCAWAQIYSNPNEDGLLLGESGTQDAAWSEAAQRLRNAKEKE
jgi:hypothetical protein